MDTDKSNQKLSEEHRLLNLVNLSMQNSTQRKIENHLKESLRSPISQLSKFVEKICQSKEAQVDNTILIGLMLKTNTSM
jgi:hypothetical protein